jgi:hypothetical protein
METNKKIGYILLIIGVLLIAIPLWQTYNIFTGNALPAQVFIRPTTLTANQNVGVLDIQGQIQNAMIKVVPIDFIDNTLNLVAWLLLMWILIYAGGKIAEIGVKLLK